MGASAKCFSAAAEAEVPSPLTVPITYIYPDGEEVEVQAEVGKHLLHVAHENDIDLEGASLLLVCVCGGLVCCA